VGQISSPKHQTPKAPLFRRRGENFTSVSGSEIGEFEKSPF